jgi:hypothetical protein
LKPSQILCPFQDGNFAQVQGGRPIGTVGIALEKARDAVSIAEGFSFVGKIVDGEKQSVLKVLYSTMH